MIKHPKDADKMANSVDPDQTAPTGAVWSESALFVQTYLSQYTNFYSNYKYLNFSTISETDSTT